MVWSRELRIDKGEIGKLTVVLRLRCTVRSLVNFQKEFLSLVAWQDRILLTPDYGQTGHVSSIPTTDEAYLVLKTCGTRQQTAEQAMAQIIRMWRVSENTIIATIAVELPEF